jgi:hypothetical protein
MRQKDQLLIGLGSIAIGIGDNADDGFTFFSLTSAQPITLYKNGISIAAASSTPHN